MSAFDQPSSVKASRSVPTTARPIAGSYAAAMSAAAAALLRERDRLTDLDRAIGDGDHGINMARGAQALQDDPIILPQMPLAELLHEIGMRLLMSVGGAAGPLYATLCLALAKALPEQPTKADWQRAWSAALAAVAARGRAAPGDKTLVDVLAAVEQRLSGDGSVTLPAVRAAAEAGATATVPMQARRGRAAFLGARSIGNMDPGAASLSLVIATICDALIEE